METRRSYKDVHPYWDGITWTADDQMPQQLRGKTLTKGNPCEGPKGLAVKFDSVEPGGLELVIHVIPERVGLAEAVAAFDTTMQAQREAFARRDAESASPYEYCPSLDAPEKTETTAKVKAPGKEEAPRKLLTVVERRRLAVRDTEDYRVSEAFDPEHDAEYPNT